MSYFFNPSTNGLGDSRIFGSVPVDAIQLEESEYLALRDACFKGKRLQLNAEGVPVSISPPLPSFADRLENTYAAQLSALDTACASAITGGFSSSALGAPHSYSSQLDDQLNLTGAVLRGLDMPYACRDAQGVKAFRPHTAEQLRQVSDDFTLYKLQLLQQANQLKQRLDQALLASDIDAMELITWEDQLS